MAAGTLIGDRGKPLFDYGRALRYRMGNQIYKAVQ